MMKTPIDAMLDGLEWSPMNVVPPTDSDLPVAVRSAVLKFCEHDLRVYHLSDGRRVIDAADMHSLLGDLIGTEQEPTHDHGGEAGTA